MEKKIATKSRFAVDERAVRIAADRILGNYRAVVLINAILLKAYSDGDNQKERPIIDLILRLSEEFKTKKSKALFIQSIERAVAILKDM